MGGQLQSPVAAATSSAISAQPPTVGVDASARSVPPAVEPQRFLQAQPQRFLQAQPPRSVQPPLVQAQPPIVQTAQVAPAGTYGTPQVIRAEPVVMQPSAQCLHSR